MKTPTGVKKKKGVFYYQDISNAIERMHILKEKHPEARVVHYGLGYGVQYRISGPYYPELEEASE